MGLINRGLYFELPSLFQVSPQTDTITEQFHPHCIYACSTVRRCRQQFPACRAHLMFDVVGLGVATPLVFNDDWAIVGGILEIINGFVRENWEKDLDKSKAPVRISLY